jgi:hypothetical protein
MTDREAVFQARNYLAEKTAPPVLLVGIEPTEQGKMLHYKTLFQSPATPPREHRIVNVHNDGTVSDVSFGSSD